MTVPAQQQSSTSITGLTPGKSTLDRTKSSNDVKDENSVANADRHHFRKLDPDPHQRENVGPGVRISIIVKIKEIRKLKN
jgi:hypothetical protein